MSTAQRMLTREQFGAVLRALQEEGYRLWGPTVRGGAIVHGELQGIEDLPAGWTERQDAGTYRLARRNDEALFGYSVGPASWKRDFFVPRLKQWTGRRGEEGFSIEPAREPPPRLALIGARSCDLHAIDIQDRTFLRGPSPDADYEARRAAVFVVAVNCGQAGGTCFCVSMKTGPRATFGYDIALTEVIDDRGHRFVAEGGSARGTAMLDRVGAADADAATVASAEVRVESAARSMGRTLDTDGIKELLYRNQEHPRWDEVAQRCLACTNCTLVCPTCFCHTVEDVTDLRGDHTERFRTWDSCFTLGHSYLHGGSVRTTVRARYRQWLTHKLASWWDQFDSSGCVGCGRCITWCPVGIDLTEEAAAIRRSDGARVPEEVAK